MILEPWRQAPGRWVFGLRGLLGCLGLWVLGLKAAGVEAEGLQGSGFSDLDRRVFEHFDAPKISTDIGNRSSIRPVPAGLSIEGVVGVQGRWSWVKGLGSLLFGQFLSLGRWVFALLLKSAIKAKAFAVARDAANHSMGIAGSQDTSSAV